MLITNLPYPNEELVEQCRKDPEWAAGEIEQTRETFKMITRALNKSDDKLTKILQKLKLMSERCEIGKLYIEEAINIILKH